jgi:hypothetical protein
MPSAARKNLILKADASVPLFEYDIKSCMPVILLSIPKPPAENTTLKAFLDGDIQPLLQRLHTRRTLTDSI